MSAPLVVVTGTGTGLGKTHVTAALVRAWARSLQERGEPSEVAGLKPVETGVVAGARTDGHVLEQASTFHVKRYPPPYMLARAVSPHLAATAEGTTIDLAVIAAYVATVRGLARGVVVELAGGLFSPLSAIASNADVARRLAPDVLLLVAPDRLGVLHDVAATTRAGHSAGLTFSGIVLVAPEIPDASTGTNARELRVVTDVPVVARVPRGTIPEAAARDDLSAIVHALITATARPPLP